MKKKLILFITLFLITSKINCEIQEPEIEHEAHSDPIEFLMFFLLFSLLVGVGLYMIHKKIKIPYTPMLLIVGIIFGFWADNLWKFGDSMTHVIKLSSHTLQYVFLPPLIYESAFNSNFFIFKRSIVQILFLALTGVAMLCIAIAVFLMYVLRYDQLGWPESLTIGSIIAATDPVAVVALLKELGTSIKFNTLLEGESLFNDGTATVFFWVFLEFINTGIFSWADFFEKFFRLSFGGAAFGLVLGFIAYSILRRTTQNPKLFVVLNISFCYLVFFLSESSFFKIHVSGILALVIYGIFLGEKLGGRLIGTTEESNHVVWGFLNYILETLLFLITGGYLGYYFHDQRTLLALTPHDIWKLIVFNLLLILARGVILLIHFPLFNLIGPDKLTLKDILVMTYAGLRGAIGLSLALIIATSTIKDTDEFKDFQILCVYYVAGTIAFTVLVNGLTIKYLMRGIKFVEETALQYKMKVIVTEKLLKKAILKIEELKPKKWLKKTNWNDVREILQMRKTMKTVTKKALIFESKNIKNRKKKLQAIITGLECLLAKKIKEKSENKNTKLKRKIKEKLDDWDSHPIKNKKKANELKRKVNRQTTKIGRSSPRKLSLTKRFSRLSFNPNERDKKKILKNLKLKQIHSDTSDDSLMSYITDSSDSDYDSEENNVYVQPVANLMYTKKLSLLDVKLKQSEFSAILSDIRLRVYGMIVSKIYELYEKGLCLYSTFHNSQNIIQILQEDNHKPISIYRHSLRYRTNYKSKIFTKLQKIKYIGKYFKRELFKSLYYYYDFLSTMLIVLIEIKNDKESIIFQMYHFKKKAIVVEIKEEIEIIKEAIDLNFKDTITAVQTRKAANIVLNSQADYINKLYHKGEITENLKEDWLGLIEKYRNKIHLIELRSSYTKLKNREVEGLKFSFPLLFDISSAELQILRSTLQKKIIKKGENLMDYDQKPSNVFLTLSGFYSVKMLNNNLFKKHGPFEIMGLENVYPVIKDKTLSKITCMADGEYYVIPLSIMRQYANNYVSIEHVCKRESLFYKLKCFKNDILESHPSFDFLKKIGSVELHDRIHMASFKKFKKGDMKTFLKAIYIFNGKMKVDFLGIDEVIQTYEDEELVDEGLKKVTFLQDSTIILFGLFKKKNNK